MKFLTLCCICVAYLCIWLFRSEQHKNKKKQSKYVNPFFNITVNSESSLRTHIFKCGSNHNQEVTQPKNTNPLATTRTGASTASCSLCCINLILLPFWILLKCCTAVSDVLSWKKKKKIPPACHAGVWHDDGVGVWLLKRQASDTSTGVTNSSHLRELRVIFSMRSMGSGRLLSR